MITYDPVKRVTCNHIESVYEDLGKIGGVRWIRWACAGCGATINEWAKGKGEHDLPPEHQEMWLTPPSGSGRWPTSWRSTCRSSHGWSGADRHRGSARLMP